MSRAILSLGANLGDREATLRDAVRSLQALDDVTVVAASSLVQTPALKPHGVDTDAPAYLNAAVAVDTGLTPEALLDRLNEIERDHGRIRAERWGDRTLDIDIVTMDRIEQSTERLTLPHPRAAERAFVLRPWLEIDPDAWLPGLGHVANLVVATSDDVSPYAAEALL